MSVSLDSNTDMKNDFVSSGRAVSDLKAHMVLVSKKGAKSIYWSYVISPSRDLIRPMPEMGLQAN